MKRTPAKLNRTFIEVTEEEDGLDPASIARYLQSTDKVVHWQDLLNFSFVVILGEAGTGKTTEFKQQAELLKEDGQPAFFLSIEDLARIGVARSLLLESRNLFKRWREGDVTAYFFLDSLDEARLRGQRFYSALRNLETDLDDAFPRAHLFLSSRVSDWRAQADRESLQSIMPNGGDNSTVRVFSLAPLDDTQVKSLAIYYRLSDVDTFLEAISKASAQVFIERPRDVEWLASYWQEKGQLGTLSDLVEYNITQKLLEKNPNHTSTISPLKARQGSEALAGIASLEQKAAFLLPDDEVPPERSAGSIDPFEILPDWKKEEIEDLLTRALFDEATYGRVRIHHRTIQEYLTAQWIRKMIDQGLASEQADSLVFSKGPNGTVVNKELHSSSAWLALINDNIRDKLVAVAPYILIDEGDPNKLPIDVRCELLRSYTENYKDRSHLFLTFDRIGLGRFAADELSETIIEILSQTGNADELRVTLLNIVTEGSITACADLAFKIAVYDTESVHVSAAAIRAVGATGSTTQKKTLIERILTRPTIHPSIGTVIVDEFCPGFLSVAQLIELVKHIEPQRKETTNRLSSLLCHQVSIIVPENDRLTLLRGLLKVLNNASDKDGLPSSNRLWLLEPVAKLFRVVVENLSDTSEFSPPIEVYETIQIFTCCRRGGFDYRHGTEDIQKIVAKNSFLRRYLFWKRVEERASELGRQPTRFFEFYNGYLLWSLSEDDIPWLINDIGNRSNFFHQLIAFDSLMRLPVRDTESEDRKRMLAKVAEVEPALQRRLERWLRSISQSYPDQAIYSRQRKAREIRQRRQDKKDRQWFHEHIEELGSGENLNALFFLISDQKEPMSRTVESMDAIVEKYGEEVLTAAKKGFKAFWRQHKPPLQHEEFNRNQVSYSVFVGLSGLALDIQEGLDFRTLSSSEADYATRYAIREINGFPKWLDLLAQAHPTVVAQVFREALIEDYQLPAEHDFVHDVLAKLPYESETIRSISAPVLGGFLSEKDPPNTDVLIHTLQAVMSTSLVDLKFISEIVDKRCHDNYGDMTRYGAWWAVWFRIAPTEAVTELERRVNAHEGQADELIEAVCDCFHRLYIVRKSDKIILPDDSQTLGRLVFLIYTHVRPEEDIEHHGAYHPGKRDHAESVRDFLFNHMTSINSEVTSRFLRKIANDSRLLKNRDWLLHLADRCDTNLSTLRSNSVALRIIDLYRKNGLEAMKLLGESGERCSNEAIKSVASYQTDASDIGILIALEEEFVQFRTLVTNMTPILDSVHGGYDYRFEIGSVDKTYQCVCRLVGNMGPERAGLFTDRLISMWRPAAVVNVGIAASIHSDVRLGDVVVADQVNAYLAETKAVPKGKKGWKFQPRPRVFHGDHALLQEVANFGFAHQKIFEEWRRAGISELGKQLGDSSLERFKNDGLINEQPTLIRAHLASGPTVVAAESFAEWIRENDTSVKAVEMEAAGLVEAAATRETPVRTLVIRGISDLGDAQKSELDATGKGAIRRLAMRNATRLLLSLFEAGVMPHYEKNN